MIKAVRAYRRALALSLLVLNLSGGRVYASSDACDHTRVFYGPSLAFKMVAKSLGCAAAKAPWKRSPPRSLGERGKHLCACDLAALRGGSSTRPVALVPGSVITLAALPRRAPPQTSVPLSSELGTVPPLHTRN